MRQVNPGRSARVGSRSGTLHVGRLPTPLHGLPACPACCRWAWPGEGGSLLPPQDFVWGRSRETGQSPKRRGESRGSKNNQGHAHMLSWCVVPTLAYGAAASDMLSLPFPPSTVAQAQPSATPSVFDCFAPVARLPHLPPLPASPFYQPPLGAGFSRDTLDGNPILHGWSWACDCSHRQPLKDRPPQPTKPTTHSRKSPALAPMFLRGSTV